MTGKIRTRQRCKCGSTFKITEEIDIICPVCGKLPTTFYIYLYWHGKDRIISRNRDGEILETYRSSRRLLERIRGEIDAGTFSLSDYTFKEIEQFRGKVLLPKWYASKVSLNRAPSHLKELKRYNKKYFTPFFGEMNCREIRTYHIDNFFQTLTGISDKTKKNIMDALRNFCNYLVDREVLMRSPKMPDISPALPTIVWTTKDVQLKIVACIPERDKPIFKFAMYHPVRPGELRALRVKHFNVEEGYVEISRAFSLQTERTRKNKRPYFLPLSQTFEEGILKDKLPDAFAFTNRDGRPYTSSGLRKIWITAVGKAEEPHINFYNATRHSIATQALRAGESIQNISAALGHSSFEITRRYAGMGVKLMRGVIDTSQILHKDNFQECKVVNLQGKMERATGFEPATPSLGSLYSTN